MYNNYYLNSSHKGPSLKQNIDKLPLNIADTIRLQGKYINQTYRTKIILTTQNPQKFSKLAEKISKANLLMVRK